MSMFTIPVPSQVPMAAAWWALATMPPVNHKLQPQTGRCHILIIYPEPTHHLPTLYSHATS